MTPLQTLWQSFEDKVLPKDAGITQRSEMRLAFMAGAHAMTAQTVRAPQQVVTIMDDSRRESDRYKHGAKAVDVYNETKETA